MTNDIAGSAKPNYTPKPDLLSVEQAKDMGIAQMTELFTTHLNPGQLHFMKLLGFHKIKIERAEGCIITIKTVVKFSTFSVVSVPWHSATTIRAFCKPSASFRKNSAMRSPLLSCRNMQPL